MTLPYLALSPYTNYNRILLSPVLAGEKTVADIVLNDEKWYADNAIKLHKGKNVIQIDRVNKCVVAEDGTTAEYNRLLLATGSRPFKLPIPGIELDGVVAFRDIHDVNTMLDAAKQGHKNAVVIGGWGLPGSGSCQWPDETTA